jgi:hypothetical protein
MGFIQYAFAAPMRLKMPLHGICIFQPPQDPDHLNNQTLLQMFDTPADSDAFPIFTHFFDCARSTFVDILP